MVKRLRAIGGLAPAAIVLSFLFHSAIAQNYPVGSPGTELEFAL